MTTTMYREYSTKGMPFRRLGSSGLRVPLFSLGGWLTLGESVTGSSVKDIIQVAFDNGINMFDTAEGYNKGQSEIAMGQAIKDLSLRRSDIIVTTKIFFGTKDGPNDTGLSRKHIIEGTKASLERLQLEYVDVIFAHVPDYTVPIEETVRAFNYVINKGWAMYWATSEWSARDIEEAHHVATRLGLIPPIAEQCQHNMFHRGRPEREYLPLYERYDLGTTVWSPLAGGLLTGKYANGIPPTSRYALHASTFSSTIERLFSTEEGRKKMASVQELGKVAEEELDCTITHLALAWLAVHQHTSTIILGASTPGQVLDNLKALAVIPKLTEEVLEKVEAILGNKPEELPTFGRPPLDVTGKTRR
ncbi:NADP-dependent oxidoreductase domain-containing protein [Irpex rosettiformis]|uniref:NADP-dependent oxidoreductase domain-containing protein n=1 Tax=Irpex rosettiformis TaxID=378272 RepID=A0ACB8UJ90_9APHY|nr:NADP-dependent oxidoreductase domain-containing protein [Irpex rosettiformis]